MSNKPTKYDKLEADRLILQRDLDAQKQSADRNRLGQFATPTALARDIVAHSKRLMPNGEAVRFLDPAIGTGSFYAALRHVFPARRICEAQGFEIDPHYSEPARQLWNDDKLKLTLGDFTRHSADSQFNLLVCNPPYVRHHHIANGEKARLQQRTFQACGTQLGGLAGLYCHFIGLSHAWLAPEAISAWLVPSEFMDVNYGQALKRYLLDQVTLLHIHRFDPNDVQFADALVSSAIVFFRNDLPSPSHQVRFTFGGTLADPKMERRVTRADLAHERKWTRFPAAGVRLASDDPTVADLFRIRRGVATGNNNYFILSEEEIERRGLPIQCFRPVLPSPRHVQADEVIADTNGVPLLDRRLFLLDSRLSERDVQQQFPKLWSYLEEGRGRDLHNRYLCRNRSPWYAQENRPPAPIVCTYLGRSDGKTGRPFRFILNHSQATVTNVYLAMYPTPALGRLLEADPDLIRQIWHNLNRIEPEQLLGEGRVYGGGLHKLEPKELAKVPLANISRSILPSREVQPLLF